LRLGENDDREWTYQSIEKKFKVCVEIMRRAIGDMNPVLDALIKLFIISKKT
jgi:hypothetical protein